MNLRPNFIPDAIIQQEGDKSEGEKKRHIFWNKEENEKKECAN
jgi:hypothetical protein